MRLPTAHIQPACSRMATRFFLLFALFHPLLHLFLKQSYQSGDPGEGGQ